MGRDVRQATMGRMLKEQWVVYSWPFGWKIKMSSNGKRNNGYWSRRRRWAAVG